jgi:hypothetical protein
MYRFHLDIPLGDNQEHAISIANQLIQDIVAGIRGGGSKTEEISYYLGADNDRSRHNYLDINENGHASGKKSKVSI